VAGQLVPGQQVGLVAEGENGLDDNVHDGHTLSTELERQDLEGVGDEQTGETNIVEDAEEPDEGDLRVAGSHVRLARVLVDGTNDGPDEERGAHASGGDQEQGATAEVVDGHGSTDGHDQVEDGLASGELINCVSKKSPKRRGT